MSTSPTLYTYEPYWNWGYARPTQPISLGASCLLIGKLGVFIRCNDLWCICLDEKGCIKPRRYIDPLRPRNPFGGSVNVSSPRKYLSTPNICCVSPTSLISMASRLRLLLHSPIGKPDRTAGVIISCSCLMTNQQDDMGRRSNSVRDRPQEKYKEKPGRP